MAQEPETKAELALYIANQAQATAQAAMAMATQFGDTATKALHQIGTHEVVCSERYKNVNDSIGVLRRIGAWVLGLMGTSMVAALGYLIIYWVKGQ